MDHKNQREPVTANTNSQPTKSRYYSPPFLHYSSLSPVSVIILLFPNITYCLNNIFTKKTLVYGILTSFLHISIYSWSQYIVLATRTMSYKDQQYLEGICKFSIVFSTTNIWKHAEEPGQESPPASAAHQNFRAVDTMISASTNWTGCCRLVGTAKHPISLDKDPSLSTSTKAPSAMAYGTAVEGAAFGLEITLWLLEAVTHWSLGHWARLFSGWISISIIWFKGNILC